MTTALLPHAFAIEEGGNEGQGGNEQGGDSGGGGSAPSSGGDGGSMSGGRRGSATAQIAHMAYYLARNLYPDVLSPSADRDPRHLTETEHRFLCSMTRIRVRTPSALLWLPSFLADMLQRPEQLVRETMERCGEE